MLSSTRKSLSRIEASFPVPVTAERFYARACRHAERVNLSVGSETEVVPKELSDSMGAEVEQIAVGSYTAIRDFAKRKVFRRSVLSRLVNQLAPEAK